MKKQLLFLVFFVLSLSTASAQWIEGNRKQSQSVKGNGAILVHNDVMYFWNEENHFQTSSDNGGTWNDPPDTISGANPHVRDMSASGDRVYAALSFGTGNGLPIYSTDQGVTWLPDTLGAPGHALGWAGRPVVSRLIAWGGKWLLVKWDQPTPFDIKTFDGPFVSNAFMNVGANHPQSFVAKGDTLFCAASKFYYTTDGGATFVTPANNGYPGSGAFLTADGNRMYVLAVVGFGNPYNLYYTDDNGENWSMIDITALTNLTVLGGGKIYPNAFFLKGDHLEFSSVQETFNTPPNIWKSTDLGATWSRDTAGLPTAFAHSIDRFAYTSDGTLWAVRSHENIYKQKIDEGTGGGNVVTTAPELLEPGQGAVLSNTEVTLSWGSVANATTYHVQVATDEAFSTIFHEDAAVAGMTKAISSLQDVTTYHWRVRGIGGDGQPGPWSVGRMFQMSMGNVDDENAVAIRISPNPAVDQMSVDLVNGQYNAYKLCDAAGRIVLVGEVENEQSMTISVAALPAGSYWLTLYPQNGAAVVAKVLIAR